jgi:rod shape determining protein RodA
MSVLRLAQDITRHSVFRHIDWYLFFAALGLSLLGLFTMRSFGADNAFFEKQAIWIALSVAAFFFASLFEYSFLRRTQIIVMLYVAMLGLLALVLSFGAIVKGAQNRFNLGFFALQPSDPAKLVLVALLAKYFARRHIEIARFRHIMLSGGYAFVLFVLVFVQPDLGGGIIIAAIWLGMVLMAGISWKHLLALFVTAMIVFAALWQYGLHPYQKQRVLTFVHPLTDIQGAGYNAYQSMVAVGSGEVLGKGIGYGTQSKLRFLPEYQTDFIFAAFAEEWGFVGVCMFLGLFSIVLVRMLMIAAHGADNFETLFASGLAIYFFAQSTVHIGMNMGLLPITGTAMPLMSYGGSHLLTEFAALGMLMGMRRHARPVVRVKDQTEFVGAL